MPSYVILELYHNEPTKVSKPHPTWDEAVAQIMYEAEQGGYFPSADPIHREMLGEQLAHNGNYHDGDYSFYILEQPNA